MNWKFWQTTDSTPGLSGRIARYAGAAVIGYLAVCVVLGWWWDEEPEIFDVRENAVDHATIKSRSLVPGYITTITLVSLGETLLDKRGGYLSNDLTPPGIWMDNIPNWEFGVLTQIRDTARAYRIDFSRSQSQSSEDKDLAEAEGKFFFDHNSWAFPRTEDEYRQGISKVLGYLDRLSDPTQPGAQFYARADNLQLWLQGIETRLGSLSQRLSASVGKRQLDTGLAGDRAAVQSTDSPAEIELKTPWLEIDDVFYEARGHTWALLHLLNAIEQDFGEVLDDKNARVSLQQIVRELEPTQHAVWSPLILNGTGFGMMANHSLVMASYIARANAAISDLRALLAQG
jgi:hypothetical protein